MRMRRAAAITSVVMLASSLSVVLAPAQAVTTISITAPNITVRLNACGRSTVTITGDWASDTYNSVEAFVTGPGGNTFAGGYWDNERTGSIAVPVRLCGSENYPGRYTVAVKAQGFGENLENPTEVNATKTFQFTKVDPRARSAITKKVRYTRGAFKWKVPGRLFRAGRGYVGRRVAVQAMVQGDWTHIAGAEDREEGSLRLEVQAQRVHVEIRLLRQRHHEAERVGRVQDTSPGRKASGSGRPAFSGLLAGMPGRVTAARTLEFPRPERRRASAYVRLAPSDDSRLGFGGDSSAPPAKSLNRARLQGPSPESPADRPALRCRRARARTPRLGQEAAVRQPLRSQTPVTESRSPAQPPGRPDPRPVPPG